MGCRDIDIITYTEELFKKFRSATDEGERDTVFDACEQKSSSTHIHHQ
jgi:hypothetical protein